MNLYETTFIVNPQVDEAEIDKQVKSVSKLITDNGGKIVREERTGTRRLAYPIRGLNQGYYATFLFEAEPPVLPALERHMKLGESYMRHLTIVFYGDPEIVYAPKSDRPFENEREDEREREGRRGFGDNRRGGGGGYRGRRDRDDDDYRPGPRNRRD
jgi:small subunit ribosomal protein S6